MDDLGVPLFSKTSISTSSQFSKHFPQSRLQTSGQKSWQQWKGKKKSCTSQGWASYNSYNWGEMTPISRVKQSQLNPFVRPFIDHLTPFITRSPPLQMLLGGCSLRFKTWFVYRPKFFHSQAKQCETPHRKSSTKTGKWCTWCKFCTCQSGYVNLFEAFSSPHFAHFVGNKNQIK